MIAKRKPVKRKPVSKPRVVTVKEEELNAVQQAIDDASAAIRRAYKRLERWYRS